MVEGAAADNTFPREASTYPISPAPVASDALIYEHATDTSITYWLPRYRLRESGGIYEIAFAEDAGLWTVRIGLDTYPAPETADAARTAQPLEHVLRVAITYGADIVRSVESSEVVPDGGGVTASFRMTLEERDALLRAFQSDAANAGLSVARGVDVALPLAEAVAEPMILILKDQHLALEHLASRAVVAPEELRVPVQPDDAPPDRPDAMVEARDWRVMGRVAAVKPLGPEQDIGIAAMRGAMPDAGLSRGGFVASHLPRPVAAQLHRERIRNHRSPTDVVVPDHRTGRERVRDHRTGRERVRDHRTGSDGPVRPRPRPEPFPVPEPTPEPGPAQPDQPARYRHSALSLDLGVPLRFDPVVHPYLYELGRGGAQRAEFERVVLRYPRNDPQAGTFAYFRDTARPNHFYYLPDEFLLARTEERPHVPALAFRLGDDASTMQFTCYVKPYTDANRLLDAREALSEDIPLGTGIDPTPVLQPIVAPATLSLSLPSGPVESSAKIDLANGFWVTEQVALSEFQDIFAVLASGTDVNTLLRGTVTVQTGLSADDQIPVELRLRRLLGEMFEQSEVWDESTGAMAVTLENATESTLQIAPFPAWLRRGSQVVTGTLEGLDLSTPVALEPEASLGFSVRPDSPLEGSDPVDAVFDFSSVAQVIDPEVALALALDDSVAMQSDRQIIVMTTEAALGGGGDPANKIDVIVVEFPGGARAVVDAEHMRVEVQVPVPLVDVLLRRDSEGAYRYRETVVYASKPPAEHDWRTSDRVALVVPTQS